MELAHKRAGAAYRRESGEFPLETPGSAGSPGDETNEKESIPCSE